MDTGDSAALERLRREIADLEAMEALLVRRMSVAKNERKAILARHRLSAKRHDPEFEARRRAGHKAKLEEPGYMDQYREASRRGALERSPLRTMTAAERIEYDGLIRKHMTKAEALSVMFPTRSAALGSKRT